VRARDNPRTCTKGERTGDHGNWPLYGMGHRSGNRNHGTINASAVRVSHRLSGVKVSGRAGSPGGRDPPTESRYEWSEARVSGTIARCEHGEAGR